MMSARRVIEILGARWEVVLLILIGVVFVIGPLASPLFLNPGGLLDQARPSLVLGVLALGLMVVVFTGEIDLSGEAVLGVSAITMGLLFAGGVPLPLAAFIAVALGATIGCLHGLLVAVLKLPSLIVTLGTLIALRGVCFLLLAERPITGFPREFVAIGNSMIPGTLIPQALIVLLVLAVLFAWLVHRTIWGRWLVFLGSNEQTARFSAVPTVAVKFSSLVVSGACSGLAGVFLVSLYASVRADIGQGMLLGVLTVVLLGGISIFGGKGSVIGVLLALVLVALLRNAMGLVNVPAEAQELVVGALLIGAVAISAFAQRARLRPAAKKTSDDPTSSLSVGAVSADVLQKTGVSTTASNQREKGGTE